MRLACPRSVAKLNSGDESIIIKSSPVLLDLFGAVGLSSIWCCPKAKVCALLSLDRFCLSRPISFSQV